MTDPARLLLPWVSWVQVRSRRSSPCPVGTVHPLLQPCPARDRWCKAIFPLGAQKESSCPPLETKWWSSQWGEGPLMSRSPAALVARALECLCWAGAGAVPSQAPWAHTTAPSCRVGNLYSLVLKVFYVEMLLNSCLHSCKIQFCN